MILYFRVENREIRNKFPVKTYVIFLAGMPVKQNKTNLQNLKCYISLRIFQLYCNAGPSTISKERTWAFVKKVADH